MNLSELSVRRPVLMTMVYVLITVICLVFLPQIDLALYPSVDFPVISVMVDCNDAGPEEIELQVAEIFEESLNSIENLDTMTSYSQDGRCMVILEFNYGTDLDDAYDDVNTTVSRITRRLPDWCDTPTVIRFDSMGNDTIMRLILSGEKTKDDLQYIAENTVEPLLSRIEGVSQVEVFGGAPTEFDIEVDPNRLEAYDLELSTISSLIYYRNIQGSGGEITQKGMDYSITTDARYLTEQEISETVIGYADDGRAILLQDVADVKRGHESGGRLQYLNGNEIVTLNISCESDASETGVARNVREALPGIQAVLDPGLTLSIQSDNTTMISDTMGEVVKSAGQGIVLAALIIFVFLRNVKSTIVISLSMPISILITLMLMAITGMSVNSMSMSGLILGIGMTVDASIIILENTYAFRERGERSAIAAILGSKNMFAAIVASTLTTICVFVPIIIYRYDIGQIGVMFQDLVITVCISLISSLFVAVTLVPALSGSILRINTRTQKPLKNKLLLAIDGALDSGEHSLRNAYVRMLNFFLNRKLLLIVLLVLLLIFSLMEFSDLGISLTPPMRTNDSVTLSLTLPAGSTQDTTKGYVFDMNENILETLPSEAYTSILLQVNSSNTGSITVQMPDITEQTYSATDVQNMLRPYLNEYPEATWIFSGGRGMSSSGIDVVVYADDSNLSLQASQDIKSLLHEHVPQIENIESDLENGAPKYAVNIDYRKAEDLGVRVYDLTETIEAALTGLTDTEISSFDADTSYDVVVRIDENKLLDIDDLSALRIPTVKGGYVRLDAVADFELGTAPLSIMREDKVRVNHITADVMDGYAASDVQNIVDATLEEYFVAPDGVRIAQQGEMTTFAEYVPTLIMIVLLALFLVYAVMAAQFESLIDPFIIFATIPLLLIGVIWIHVAMNQAFSLFSIVGIVALIGVVVNNGIVLIDCINRLVKEKVPVKQACLQAAYGRLRPILMTTLTTILGMIPLAFFPGEGAEMMQPIALTFVGGIITGAFLTLLLSPTLYLLLNKHKEDHYDDPESLTNQLRDYDMRQLKHLDDIVG